MGVPSLLGLVIAILVIVILLRILGLW